jgi:hypothetical protein
MCDANTRTVFSSMLPYRPLACVSTCMLHSQSCVVAMLCRCDTQSTPHCAVGTSRTSVHNVIAVCNIQPGQHHLPTVLVCSRGVTPQPSTGVTPLSTPALSIAHSMRSALKPSHVSTLVGVSPRGPSEMRLPVSRFSSQ